VLGSAPATTSPEHERLLRASGVDRVFIDNGVIADQVREVLPGGADKVLELVGDTRLDSLRCAKPRGIVCITGTVGEAASPPGFRPMEAIPSTVCVMSYHGGAENFMQRPLQTLIERIAAGELPIQVGKLFTLEQVHEAHLCMEENKGGGKIVILTSNVGP
jgi:NADPH:quinone reductase-like Zn-dependent oxidoreductase